jgi:DNA invertase Pin-like site-specific DNA recombinase
MPAFTRYIGIDYSGAETPTASLKGLRVYRVEGAAPPVEVPPPPRPRKHWTRRGIAEWLVERLSGKNGREKRPAFDRLCTAMTRRECDLVAAWSVDRLGRSLQDLVSFLGELHAKSVDLYLHQQGIDTSTPAGKVLFQMMGVFAEFERSIIVERVRSGLARARAQGKRLGRPRIDPNKERAIRTALTAGGKGMLKVAAEFGVGSGTVQRIKEAMAGG